MLFLVIQLWEGAKQDKIMLGGRKSIINGVCFFVFLVHAYDICRNWAYLRFCLISSCTLTSRQFVRVYHVFVKKMFKAWEQPCVILNGVFIVYLIFSRSRSLPAAPLYDNSGFWHICSAGRVGGIFFHLDFKILQGETVYFLLKFNKPK